MVTGYMVDFMVFELFCGILCALGLGSVDFRSFWCSRLGLAVFMCVFRC